MGRIICEDTTKMTTKEWEAARQHGPNGDIPVTLGGSDAGAVMGVSPYTSVNELWLRKSGRIPEPERSEELQRRLDIGHIGEGFIAQLFAHVTGFKVRDDNRMFQHESYDWALANIDRLYVDDKGETGILEIKTVSGPMRKEWDEGAIPPQYEAQIRFYMGVLDIDRAAIIGCWGFGSNDYSIVFVDRDARIEKKLFQKCDAFVQSVLNGEEPPIQGNGEREKAAIIASLSPLKKTVLEREPSQTVEDALTLQKEIKKAKDTLKAMENQMDLYQAQILRDLDGAASAIYARAAAENHVLFDAKEIVTARLDTTALKKDHPDLCEAYTKTSNSTRFTIKEVR